MTRTSRTAAVVGGGIGGLATAIQLTRGGWTVSLFERAESIPRTGTALGLWPPALAALDTLDLGEAVREAGRSQSAGAVLRVDGRRIATLDVAALARRAGDTVRLLSRPRLLALLRDALPTGVIRFGSPVDDIRALEGEYDAVIAADGINSPARTALFGPAHRPVHTGVTAWRGTVMGDTDAVSETWGEASRFGITPQEGGRTNWFACARRPEGERAPGHEVPELRARFGHWHAGVRDILDRLDESALLRHDLYHLAPALPSYVKGRIALIGDAAHAMTPDLGRGACEALVDGVAVASALLAEPDVPTALRAYDRHRRGPTQRLARTARILNRAVHTRHRRLAVLRDAAIRTALAVSGSSGSP